MKQTILILLSLLLFAACKPASQTESPAEEPIRKVLISTPLGDMKAVLYNETPGHRDNFVKLVSSGFYDGLLFHRVMSDFMIQGGDPDSKTAEPGQLLGMGDNGYTLPAELGKGIHKKGALSAARLPDQVNPEKASSGCQFFIVSGQSFDAEMLHFFERKNNMTYTEEQMAQYQSIGGRPDLDYEYTVFGEVIEGLEVLDSILKMETDEYDRPFQNVSMKIQLINE
jgi:cyclophilin family peptidyl-prolyl cis-trans isomerase